MRPPPLRKGSKCDAVTLPASDVIEELAHCACTAAYHMVQVSSWWRVSSVLPRGWIPNSCSQPFVHL
eukprot:SAG11_NODE_33082_length_279_cov_0.694444_1_plen_66_part_01